MKSNFKFIFVVIALTLIDLSIKYYFKNNQTILNGPFFSISYTENHGVMLGLFSNVPTLLKNVLLSIIGFSFLAIYLLVLLLARINSKFTLISMSVILAGLIGNISERMIYGFVTDYISFNFNFVTTPFLNFADLIQIIALPFFLLGIYREINLNWPENDRRQAFWIDKNYQSRFCGRMIGIYLISLIVVLSFNFAFIRYTLIELKIYSPEEATKYLLTYLTSFMALLLFLTVAMYFVYHYISSQISGPIYAIKRHLHLVKSGETTKVKLRENDDFKDLEKSLNEFLESIEGNSKN